MLVDGNSNRPESIDILLGAEVFFEVLCHDKNIRSYGEIEEFPNKTWTSEEILCEEHFKKHTAQDDTGRNIVRLPRH